MSSTIGPIVFDLIGTALSAEEREILQHPLIGGVIVFARNYESVEQITQLCKSIRQSRKKPILITVDQEGGRVQRFRAGFTRLPAMGEIGKLYMDSRETALQLANISGWVMAAEVLAVGVDLSYAPVLDLDKGINPAINSRAFSLDKEIVMALATAFCEGMRAAGMAAVGKHFPGHGSVTVDSHLALPVDERSFAAIEADDMVTFTDMVRTGIEGMMASHILFPKVDAMPVGFSPYWLKEILRKQLKFNGLIFSDDLSMQGAVIAGDYPERTKTALEAGCDMALVCNHREGVIQVLDALSQSAYLVDENRYMPLLANFQKLPQNVKKTPEWVEKISDFNKLLDFHQVVV